MGWFRAGSDNVRLNELERRILTLEDRFTKVTREVLEATETLNRVTKRAFRLQEQAERLEASQKPKAPENEDKVVQRAQILRQYGRL